MSKIWKIIAALSANKKSDNSEIREISEFEQLLKIQIDQLKNKDELQNLFLAIIAIAIAAASADGSRTREEEREISEFIKVIRKTELNENTIQEIEKLTENRNQLDLNQALKYMNNFKPYLPLFEEVIDEVIFADKNIDPGEQKLWEDFKKLSVA